MPTTKPVVFNPVFQIYEKAKPIASTYYGKNKTIADYNYLEPRAAIAYQFNDNNSIKASYNAWCNTCN
jgi:hypothetical protein